VAARHRPFPTTEGGASVPADEPPICSAKGCRAEAVWVLAWNNPKLHTPDRRKAWATCEQHREQLAQFLQLRGFLRETVPLDRWDAAQ
jgi:hypothetical protein